jgi:hypothetical protein
MKSNCILPNQASNKYWIFSSTSEEPNMKSIEASYQVSSQINQFERIKLKSKENLSEKKNINDVIITIHNNFVP